MDNIIIEKIWFDTDAIELKIRGNNKYVGIYQHCYVDRNSLKEVVLISLNKFKSKEYIFLEFGNREGNYTPSFSLKVIKIKNNGEVILEVDFEIQNSESRANRCNFWVTTFVGSLEEFLLKLSNIDEFSLEEEIVLNTVLHN